MTIIDKLMEAIKTKKHTIKKACDIMGFSQGNLKLWKSGRMPSKRLQSAIMAYIADTSDSDKCYGARLSQARRRFNHTQTEAQAYMGLQSNQLSRWENGHIKPVGINRRLCDRYIRVSCAMIESDSF